MKKITEIITATITVLISVFIVGLVSAFILKIGNNWESTRCLLKALNIEDRSYWSYFGLSYYISLLCNLFINSPKTKK